MIVAVQHGWRGLGLALSCGALGLGCATWQQPGERLGAVLGEGARYVHTRRDRAVYVEDHGPRDATTTPVLFVHGFASNHDVWRPLEPALSPARRTVNVDLPGFGWSTRTEGDYSPQALADDLDAVLEQLSIARADVVAHSWGSSVTLALALGHRARVRRIVLIGGWVYDEQIPPFFRWARTPGVGEMLFSGFYTERPADRFPQAFEDPSVVSQALVEAIEASLIRPGTSRAALAAARGQAFLQMEGQYRTIAHDTLLLWGANDNVARPRFGQRLAREMPHARYHAIEQTGHFPMIEAPGETRRVVTEFLDRPEPSP
ncbi:MAG: alpha/beta hydrolase [Myxococcales bacterium]|nr:alpha/beta hydrolase [Myxococcales bacterium]